MLTGAVTLCPNAERTVTVAGVAGPLPVVVTDKCQRAPVVAAFSVAVPRFSGPLVVAAVTVMLLPVATEVVPDRSQA
ncbi:hypothetical protein D3C77_682830 [compost metagenome]